MHVSEVLIDHVLKYLTSKCIEVLQI